MKPVDKAGYLAHLEQQVEGHIQEAVQRFQNLNEVELDRPSSTGGWSITQCLAHLNSYGHYYLPRLQQGLEQQRGKPATTKFVSSWLGSYLTKLMDPRTGKAKFRAIKGHRPPNGLSAYAIVAQFIDQQEELLRLLRAAKGLNINEVSIPLSIVGWVRLPLGDILQFMVAHTKRHLQQANRNR